MKKRLISLLALLCALLMLVGCGAGGTQPEGGSSGNNSSSKETTPESQNSDGSAASLYATVEKPDKIVWWVHDGMKEEDGTDQWVKEFESKTGIKMELGIIDNNEYYKKLELAYASQTVPDTFDLNGESLGTYAAQGAIVDLTDLVMESGLYDLVDKALWDAVTLDGKIYGIPREYSSACVTYVRKDWLDRLGMEIPTTYDEFINMLTRFKNEIPECTVPYTAPGLYSAQSLAEFYQGATADYVKVDGKWVDGMAQDNMLTALENMQKAYAAGLIDQEVVTNKTSNCRDQWYSGGVGVFAYWDGNWGGTLTQRVQQNVPEAEVVAIPPIEGATYLYSTPSVQVISSRLSEEKIAQIFKYFVMYARDGGEGQVLFQSGVEGVHWEQVGDKLSPLPSLSNPEDPFRKAWITPWLGTTPMNLTDKNMDLSDAITDSLAVAKASGEMINVFPVSEQRTIIAADLKTARENIIARVVMGQLSPEEGMAEYKTQAENLNVALALSQMNGEG